ncbi:unnamed protein product, partial [Discosporangium mesarthrocarpum]
SSRAPSATLGLLLIYQLQFLATLALVGPIGSGDEKNGNGEPSVSNVDRVGEADEEAWVNLWWSPGDHAEYALCAEDENHQLGGDVFVGNTALVLGLLLAILMSHVVIVSAVEASWVAQDHAELTVARARLQGMTVRDLEVEEMAKNWDFRAVLPTLPLPQTETPPATPAPPAPASAPCHSPGSDPWASDNSREVNIDRRREVEERAVALDPILYCRSRSSSFWLHFPHLELIFLLFAFEGAVVAQGSMLRSSCPWIFWTALSTLLGYPVLMILMVCRTIAVRILPDDLLVFRCDPDNRGIGRGGRCANTPGHFSKVRTLFGFLGFLKGEGIFTWADRGRWESVHFSDKATQREAHWFRIGFEPLFVDFTKRGSIYLVVLLMKWFLVGFVGAMVDSRLVQLSFFFLIHTVDFFVLLWYKPFANSVINTLELLLVAVDALSAAMLDVATLLSGGSGEGGEDGESSGSSARALENVLTIPIYLDTAMTLGLALRYKIRKLFRSSAKRSTNPTPQEEIRAYTSRAARREWPRYWSAMLLHNITACVYDTREGVRLPHPRRARRRPY